MIVAVAESSSTFLHFAKLADVSREYVGRRRDAKVLHGETLGPVRLVDPSGRRVCNACMAMASSDRVELLTREEARDREVEVIRAKLNDRGMKRELETQAVGVQVEGFENKRRARILRAAVAMTKIVI